MREAPITAIAVATAALLLPLAGCGDDEGGGEKTVTVQETVGPGDTVGDDVTTGGPPASTVSEPPAKAKRGPHYFQTPSENIGCYVSQRNARCDIREREWKPTPP